jgi:hypothetical protein
MVVCEGCAAGELGARKLRVDAGMEKMIETVLCMAAGWFRG